MATRCFEFTRQRCLFQPPFCELLEREEKKRNEWVTNGWRSCREWVCPDASLIDGKGGIDSWRATDSPFLLMFHMLFHMME